MRCTKFSKLLLAIVISVFAPYSMAADHKEAPLIKEDPSADIADVYAFRNPNTGNLVLIMTVNGFTARSENVNFNFSPNAEYWFQVDNTGDGRPNRSIRVAMTSLVDGPQQFTAEFPDNVTVSGMVTPPTEDPVAADPIIVNGPNGIRVFAGQRDDPFFFDVVGLGRVLAGGAFTNQDGFAGFNVSAIAVELPAAMVADGSNNLGIWAETRRRNVIRGGASQIERTAGRFRQIERMGNPAVNTVLIPLANKDQYNVNPPRLDGRDFAGDIVATLQSLGTNDDFIGILASVAIPDTLKLDLTADDGFPNGRLPQDDVIDTLLFLIFNGTPVSDGVDANDQPFLTVFPFLAPPFQPN